jgi:hypothetical protein
MRLLLTSGGVTNPSIARALFDLAGREPEAASLVFVPTAANVEEGDIEDAVRGATAAVYALDDASALKVAGGEVEVISEGAWRVYGAAGEEP